MSGWCHAQALNVECYHMKALEFSHELRAGRLKTRARFTRKLSTASLPAACNFGDCETLDAHLSLRDSLLGTLHPQMHGACPSGSCPSTTSCPCHAASRESLGAELLSADVQTTFQLLVHDCGEGDMISLGKRFGRYILEDWFLWTMGYSGKARHASPNAIESFLKDPLLLLVRRLCARFALLGWQDGGQVQALLGWLGADEARDFAVLTAEAQSRGSALHSAHDIAQEVAKQVDKLQELAFSSAATGRGFYIWREG